MTLALIELMIVFWLPHRYNVHGITVYAMLLYTGNGGEDIVQKLRCIHSLPLTG